MTARIDSTTIGDAARFLAFDTLIAGLDALPAAPPAHGRVALLVSRGEDGVRTTPTRVRLTPDGGMPDDAWSRAALPNPDGQLAVMQTDVATLIANGQALPLFGDNLFLDLDLQRAQLPTGSRLRAGEAILEVTPKPHNGCAKFRARFGDAALRLVCDPDRRHRNLRGIYLRVIAAGDVACGDPVTVLARGPALRS